MDLPAPHHNKMRRTSGISRDTRIFRVAAAVFITASLIAGLYVGRSLLVPVALAVLFAFALAPLVKFVGATGIPRSIAVIISVFSAVLVVIGTIFFIGNQLVPLTGQIPQYQKNLTAKIQSASGSALNSAMLRNVESLLQGFDSAVTGRQLLARSAAQTSTLAKLKTPDEPVAVQIQRPAFAPTEVINGIAEWLLEPLISISLIVIFVIFILLQKDDLRDRFITLAGGRDIQRMAQAIDDGATRLSRYLLLQTSVNAAFGTIIFAGLWAVGIPTPGLWGLVGGLFRFVPYVGVPIAAILPVILSLAVDPGWSMVVLTLALYLSVEILMGQALEPWLYGRHMGLSPTAVILSAGFWTIVWGPIGLLLSTPLTMCLVVLGRHAEGMEFLETLLGNEAPLSMEEGFYLRMLAGNFEEMADLAEQYLKTADLNETLEMVVRALSLAQIDIDRKALSKDHVDEIAIAFKKFLEGFEERRETERESDGTVVAVQLKEKNVLCVAGRNLLDEAVSSLLVSALAAHNIKGRVLSAEDASPAAIDEIEISTVSAVCLVYLRPGNSRSPQLMERRWRKRAPGMPVLISFWGNSVDDLKSLESFMHEPHEYIVRSFSECVDVLSR